MRNISSVNLHFTFKVCNNDITRLSINKFNLVWYRTIKTIVIYGFVKNILLHAIYANVETLLLFTKPHPATWYPSARFRVCVACEIFYDSWAISLGGRVQHTCICPYSVICKRWSRRDIFYFKTLQYIFCMFKI